MIKPARDPDPKKQLTLRAMASSRFSRAAMIASARGSRDRAMAERLAASLCDVVGDEVPADDLQHVAAQLNVASCVDIYRGHDVRGVIVARVTLLWSPLAPKMAVWVHTESGAPATVKLGRLDPGSAAARRPLRVAVTEAVGAAALGDAAPLVVDARDGFDFLQVPIEQALAAQHTVALESPADRCNRAARAIVFGDMETGVMLLVQVAERTKDPDWLMNHLRYFAAIADAQAAAALWLAAADRLPHEAPAMLTRAAWELCNAGELDGAIRTVIDACGRFDADTLAGVVLTPADRRAADESTPTGFAGVVAALEARLEWPSEQYFARRETLQHILEALEAAAVEVTVADALVDLALPDAVTALLVEAVARWITPESSDEAWLLFNGDPAHREGLTPEFMRGVRARRALRKIRLLGTVVAGWLARGGRESQVLADTRRLVAINTGTTRGEETGAPWQLDAYHSGCDMEVLTFDALDDVDLGAWHRLDSYDGLSVQALRGPMTDATVSALMDRLRAAGLDPDIEDLTESQVFLYVGDGSDEDMA